MFFTFRNPLSLRPMFKLTVICFCIAALMYSCSTDFDLNADYQETPVIYTLLDASVDTQYIRINRAFLSNETNAIVLATDPDEIYYGGELTVHLEEYNNGNLVASSVLEPVNGDTLGMPKNEGIFANTPNILYRYLGTVNPVNTYKIVAENSETGKSVTAETEVVDEFSITRPNDESPFPQYFSVSPLASYQLKWESAQDARIYDLRMRFHYREGTYFPSGDSVSFTTSGFADWVMETNYTVESTTGGLTLTYDIFGASFYSFIKNTFEPVADNDFIRIADSVQFFIDAGGEELYNYYQFNLSSLGITEGQVTETYTNVEGGLGIVSSRFHKVGGIFPVSSQTRDSLACSTITTGLNFITDASNPDFPYCD